MPSLKLNIIFEQFAISLLSFFFGFICLCVILYVVYVWYLGLILNLTRLNSLSLFLLQRFSTKTIGLFSLILLFFFLTHVSFGYEFLVLSVVFFIFIPLVLSSRGSCYVYQILLLLSIVLFYRYLKVMLNYYNGIYYFTIVRSR